MARPSMPNDGDKPWGTVVRNAIFAVSDQADLALSTALSAVGTATTALNTANTNTTAINSHTAAINALQTTVSSLQSSTLPDGSVTNAKIATNANISADKLVDGTTKVVMLATERQKLTDVNANATVNSTDTFLRARGNHTGTQLASTISDLATTVNSLSLVQPVAKTGDYTLVASDHNKAIEISGGIVTLPNPATVGQVTEILRTGDLDVTIVAAAGAVVEPASGLKLRTKFSTCTVRARTATKWHIAGDLTTATEVLDPLGIAPAYNVPVVTFGLLGSTAVPTSALGGTPVDADWKREKREGVAETVGVGGVANNLDIAGSTRYRYYGFPTAIPQTAQPTNYVETQYMPGADPQFAYYPFNLEFDCTGSVAQIRSNATSATPFLGAVFVDGLMVQEAQYSATGLTSGSGFHMTLTFPDARARSIKIMCFNRGQGRFGGIASNGTITKPTSAIKRVVIIGDSYVGGASGVGAADTFAKKLSLLVGGRQANTSLQIITLGVGGTGVTTALSGQPNSVFSGRVAPALAMSPDILIFAGGRNDVASGLQTATEALFDSTNSVTERYWVPTASNSTQSAQRTALQTACANKGVLYADVNIDAVEKVADNVHPTYAGHQALASDAWAKIGTLV